MACLLPFIKFNFTLKSRDNMVGFLKSVVLSPANDRHYTFTRNKIQNKTLAKRFLLKGDNSETKEKRY